MLIIAGVPYVCAHMCCGPFHQSPVGNRLSCSATVSIVDIGTSQIAITWTQPTCSELMPDHYLVQWVPEGSSTPVLSDPIATSNNSYNITNLAPNMRYAISLLVVDFCGPTTAASLTAITNSELICLRLFNMGFWVIILMEGMFTLG